MYSSKKHIVWRIVFALIMIMCAASAAALLLYYSNIHALNMPQSYKGIFI